MENEKLYPALLPQGPPLPLPTLPPIMPSGFTPPHPISRPSCALFFPFLYLYLLFPFFFLSNYIHIFSFEVCIVIFLTKCYFISKLDGIPSTSATGPRKVGESNC